MVSAIRLRWVEGADQEKFSDIARAELDGLRAAVTTLA
ncbi:hypothetical protein EV193_10968 [Herbihabitans rhizosphaerae]|uniref:Uncharacterized protein n=1 Tax=Herbihabitans rhizosphaerae TaxID=1872711 RepID=A0A4Q7KHB8_9PSEU|nr:hypothetical protein EV193_10968 [Herbihabitans rhizosphaerae]